MIDLRWVSAVLLALVALLAVTQIVTEERATRSASGTLPTAVRRRAFVLVLLLVLLGASLAGILIRGLTP